MKEKSKIDDLNKPRSDGKIFTYSENKLLDQITLEITEAWAKDLKVIKKAHEKSETLLEKITDVINFTETELPKFSEFLKDLNLTAEFSKMKSQIDTMFGQMGVVYKEIFEIKEKNKYEYITQLNKNINNLEKQISDLEERIKKLDEKPRRWWKKLFKPRK